MTVDAWDPSQGTTDPKVDIDQAFLRRCLQVVTDDKLESLADVLSPQDQANNAIIHATAEQWQNATTGLSNQQLIDLIRFFTMIEAKLNHWQAGSKSPAIALNTLLKQRGAKLDKTVLQWIREHSTNRFIPNGAVL